jgi:hypothetical protein
MTLIFWYLGFMIAGDVLAYLLEVWSNTSGARRRASLCF